MGLGTGATAAIVGGIGAAGSIAGGAIASHGANTAAKTAAAADTQAAQLNYNLGEDQLGFNKQVYQNALGLAMPSINTGTAGLNQLAYLLGIKVPQSTPFTPSLPTSGNTAFPGAGVPYSGGQPGPALPIGGRQPSTASANLKMRGADGAPILDRAALGTPPEALGPYNPARITPDTASPAVFANGATTANDAGTSQVPQTLTEASGVPTSTNALNPDLGGFGSLMTPFTAPTDVTEQNDPGYKFRLQLAQEAMERSAAARGDLLTGGTAQAESQMAQDYASNEYNNVYNRAFNTFETNQNNTFNRLAAIAGIGQTGTQQLMGAGSSAAGTGGYISANTGQNVGNAMQNAAAARASGYANAGNIWGNAIGGGTNSIGNLLLMSQLLGGGGIPAAPNAAPGNLPLPQPIVPWGGP